jgi:archaellum component FlaC
MFGKCKKCEGKQKIIDEQAKKLAEYHKLAEEIKDQFNRLHHMYRVIMDENKRKNEEIEKLKKRVGKAFVFR